MNYAERQAFGRAMQEAATAERHADGWRHDFYTQLNRACDAEDDRDRLAAALERVRSLCDTQGDDSYVMTHALRKALRDTETDEPT